METYALAHVKPAVVCQKVSWMIFKVAETGTNAGYTTQKKEWKKLQCGKTTTKKNEDPAISKDFKSFRELNVRLISEANAIDSREGLMIKVDEPLDEKSWLHNALFGMG